MTTCSRDRSGAPRSPARCGRSAALLAARTCHRQGPSPGAGPAVWQPSANSAADVLLLWPRHVTWGAPGPSTVSLAEDQGWGPSREEPQASVVTGLSPVTGLTHRCHRTVPSGADFVTQELSRVLGRWGACCSRKLSPLSKPQLFGSCNTHFCFHYSSHNCTSDLFMKCIEATLAHDV